MAKKPWGFPWGALRGKPCWEIEANGNCISTSWIIFHGDISVARTPGLRRMREMSQGLKGFLNTDTQIDALQLGIVSFFGQLADNWTAFFAGCLQFAGRFDGECHLNQWHRWKMGKVPKYHPFFWKKNDSEPWYFGYFGKPFCAPVGSATILLPQNKVCGRFRNIKKTRQL